MCNQVNLSFHLPAEMLHSVDVVMRLNTLRADSCCWGSLRCADGIGRGGNAAASLEPTAFLTLGEVVCAQREFLGSATPVKPFSPPHLEFEQTQLPRKQGE